jgi:hypothetical protein
MKTLEWRWKIARACITPISEDPPQKEGRLLIAGRSFRSSCDEQAIATKAHGALLFP